jgi:YebC/PmpR family DNA-binding regulatory protein
MSGHSHWATIRRKKGAADAKRGQVFTRLAREIVIAAREGGGDPSSNVRLQYAIERARAQNMPKDNIERAIKRGTGELKEGSAYEEVSYEGYAPHGIALMISVVTDNRNRAVAEIRHILNRMGGSMADAGSVAWQFSRKAYFSFPAEGEDTDTVFELAVEAGAEDVTFDDDTVEIFAL